MPNIAEQIAAVRTSLGLSVERAALSSRIAAGRWRDLELDGQPTTYELSCVAHALAVSPIALLSAAGGVSTRTTVRFRAPAGATTWSPVDAQRLAQCAEVARVGAWLEGLLQQPPSALRAHRSVTAFDSTRPAWEQGYELGERMRTELSPSARSIPSMEALLDGLGVHVARVHFDTSDVLAASLFDGDGMPTILLNEGASRVGHALSRRALLAHELCHLLHDGGEAELAMVSELHDGERLEAESRANGFAPAFIVPRSWLAAFEEPAATYVRDVAESWGLTFEGAAWHVKNAFRFRPEWVPNLLRSPVAVAPVISFESPLPRRSATEIGLDEAVSPLVAGRVSDLALEAAQKELISVGRAREILAWG